MVGKSNKNIFLIQIDASSFAEFEISEFEISRVDCRIPKFPRKEDLLIMQTTDIEPFFGWAKIRCMLLYMNELF